MLNIKRVFFSNKQFSMQFGSVFEIQRVLFFSFWWPSAYQWSRKCPNWIGTHSWMLEWGIEPPICDKMAGRWRWASRDSGRGWFAAFDNVSYFRVRKKHYENVKSYFEGKSFSCDLILHETCFKSWQIKEKYITWARYLWCLKDTNI